MIIFDKKLRRPEEPIFRMILDLQRILISAPGSLQAFIVAGLVRDSASLLRDKMY